MSDTEKVVNWSNWTQYIDVSEDEKTRPTPRRLHQGDGIKVNYTEDYNDNDEFYAKVRPAPRGRPGHRSRRVVQHRLDGRPPHPPGLRAAARQRQHPERQGTSSPALKDVEFDPGRKYSLPWQTGFAGIAYNLEATGGKKIETMTQLLTDPALKGKVTLLSEMRDTVGLVLSSRARTRRTSPTTTSTPRSR